MQTPHPRLTQWDDRHVKVRARRRHVAESHRTNAARLRPIHLDARSSIFRPLGRAQPNQKTQRVGSRGFSLSTIVPHLGTIFIADSDRQPEQESMNCAQFIFGKPGHELPALRFKMVPALLGIKRSRAEISRPDPARRPGPPAAIPLFFDAALWRSIHSVGSLQAALG